MQNLEGFPNFLPLSTSHVFLYLRYQREMDAVTSRKLRFISRDRVNDERFDYSTWWRRLEMGIKKLRDGEACVEKCEAVNDLIELKKTRNWKYYYRGENFGRWYDGNNSSSMGEGGLVSIILRKCWTFGLASVVLCSFVWSRIVQFVSRIGG